MKWYLIDSGFFNGEKNMAYDLAMMDFAKRGNAILRLYGWHPPALSLGKFQKLESVDVGNVRKQGFDLVRRPSGGRAVLHMDEVTYAFAVPESFLPKSVLKSYMEISQALISGLKKLGLEVYMAQRTNDRYTDFAACFATTSLHEIMVDGKKLIGSAQTRKNGVVLQHGSIPMLSHIDEYVKCFNLNEKDREILKKRLYRKTTCVLEHVQVKEDDVKKAILHGFSEKFGVEFSPLNEGLEWEKHVMEVKLWD